MQSKAVKWENSVITSIVNGVSIFNNKRNKIKSLIALNRMDWNFVWSAIFHASNYHNTKIVLKVHIWRQARDTVLLIQKKLLYERVCTSLTIALWQTINYFFGGLKSFQITTMELSLRIKIHFYAIFFTFNAFNQLLTQEISHWCYLFFFRFDP